MGPRAHDPQWAAESGANADPPVQYAEDYKVIAPPRGRERVAIVTTDLFAGIGHRLRAALQWYERLLGAPPAFSRPTRGPCGTLGASWLYIVQRPEGAGQASSTVFVATSAPWVARVREPGHRAGVARGHEGGVRKTIYRDADGNEVASPASPGA
jgi:catechol 2,3-dioxygenase-like lactoylglutathione lyase family enzyme